MSENEGGRLIGDALSGQSKSAARGAERPHLRVFDTAAGHERLLFHFSTPIRDGLFSSPPAIHPSAPLVVWPIGGQDVLFANVGRNTYFVRELCCSHRRSRLVFNKSRFSRDGRHLHFAALEARPIEESPEEKKASANGCMDLFLQVSTHRLSSKKPARCPPRLCHRTTTPLGHKAKLHVGHLPYTLTWTDEHLYLAAGTESQTLSVIKIPLFPTAKSVTPQTPISPVRYNQGSVFLPRMDLSRRVRYFPLAPAPPVGSGTRSHRKERSHRPPKGTLVISSHCSIPSLRHLMPSWLASPPIVVYLDEEKDLGPWTSEPYHMDGEDGQSAAAGRRAGGKVDALAGRLKSKWEVFDRQEDCDIVPFLI